jgi:hypothetical protein
MKSTEFIQKISVFNDKEIIRLIGPDKKHYRVFGWDYGKSISPDYNNILVFYIYDSASLETKGFTLNDVRDIINYSENQYIEYIMLANKNLKFFLPK